MAQTLVNILLIGAGGTVGTHILEALLNGLEHDDDSFKITILTRPDSAFQLPERAAKLERPPTVVRHNYEYDTFLTAFNGQHAVVCAGSVQTVLLQKDMLRAAQAVGVKYFVLNEFANSYKTKGLPQMEPLRQPKREVLALAEELASKDDSFAWSALVTGNFIDLSLRKFPVYGFNFQTYKARIIDNGKEKITASTLGDIGIAIRGMLRRPWETRNRFCYIRSTEASQADMLAAVEDLTERKWEVEKVEARALYESGKERFAFGDRAAMLDLLVVQLFEEGAGRSIVATKEENDNDLLGIREKHVKDIVAVVLKDLGM